MENSTKRLRKARRQGLSTGGRRDRISGRAVTGATTNPADFPHEPSPGERRKTVTTTRKVKRQQSSAATRGRARAKTA